MKKYVVTWGNEEKEFDDIKKAVDFADKTGVSTGSNAYVWGELDGVRDEEPFFSCTWSI